MAAMFLNP